jgi:hypothetical protein
MLESQYTAPQVITAVTDVTYTVAAYTGFRQFAIVVPTFTAGLSTNLATVNLQACMTATGGTWYNVYLPIQVTASGSVAYTVETSVGGYIIAPSNYGSLCYIRLMFNKTATATYAAQVYMTTSWQ